jgi:hypothetical protein
MPRPRIGALPMTPAQRQARHRARLRVDCPLPPAPQRHPLPRPQRWAAAVARLIALQDEYRAWLDNLPDSLEGSRLAEKLQVITEFDSRSCTQSTYRVVTAATDTAGPPLDQTSTMVEIAELDGHSGPPNDTVAPPHATHAGEGMGGGGRAERVRLHHLPSIMHQN